MGQLMRVLLTGGTGLIGWTLLRQIPMNWDVFATLHQNLSLLQLDAPVKTIRLDLTSRQQVRDVVEQVQPEVIIHTASVGDLDHNEERQHEAWQVNVEGTRFLLEESEPFNPQFVFCSTIYVFDGGRPPYDEESYPAPVNFYGRTKLAAEQLAQQISRRLLVLRPTATYGWHLPGQRQNWVTWLLTKLNARQPVKVVDDVFSNYIWVSDVTRAILAGIEKQAHGIFHLGGTELVSRYEFSLQIASVFGYEQGLIAPVSSDCFPGLAPRPQNTACSIRKMIDVLGINPLTIDQGLQLMKAQNDLLFQKGSLGDELEMMKFMLRIHQCGIR